MSYLWSYLCCQLRHLQKKHSDLIGDVRCLGLNAELEFVKNAITKEPATEVRKPIAHFNGFLALLLLILNCLLHCSDIYPLLLLMRAFSWCFFSVFLFRIIVKHLKVFLLNFMLNRFNSFRTLRHA